jgi:hypothetical protein
MSNPLCVSELFLLKLRNNVLFIHLVKIKDKQDRDDHEPTCQNDDPYFFILNRICVHRAPRGIQIFLPRSFSHVFTAFLFTRFATLPA